MSDYKFTHETVEAGVGGIIVTEAVRILMENKLKSQSKTLNNLLSKGTGLASSLIWQQHGSAIKQHVNNALNNSKASGAEPHSVKAIHAQASGASLANQIWADHHR